MDWRPELTAAGLIDAADIPAAAEDVSRRVGRSLKAITVQYLFMPVSDAMVETLLGKA